MHIDQSNLNYIPKKPVVMIAVIHIVGIPCCFRTYGIVRLLLVGVRDVDVVNAFGCATVHAMCGAVYVKTKDIMVVFNFFSFENYQIKE